MGFWKSALESMEVVSSKKEIKSSRTCLVRNKIKIEGLSVNGKAQMWRLL